MAALGQEGEDGRGRRGTVLDGTGRGRTGREGKVMGQDAMEWETTKYGKRRKEGETGVAFRRDATEKTGQL